MNSWKSINLSREYDSQRIFFLSLFTILLSFIIIHTITAPFMTGLAMYDDHSLLLIIFIILLYPVHKLLHYLPLLGQLHKIKTQITYNYNFLPTIKIIIHDPISKHLFLLTLFIPFFIVSLGLLTCTLTFPNYTHYFTILFALHTGLCVTDFICLKTISGSPNRCFVEEHADGYDILTLGD